MVLQVAQGVSLLAVGTFCLEGLCAAYHGGLPQALHDPCAAIAHEPVADVLKRSAVRFKFRDLDGLISSRVLSFAALLERQVVHLEDPQLLMEAEGSSDASCSLGCNALCVTTGLEEF